MIMIDEESVVLVTEISNSYILLSKDKKNKITKKDDGTIVLPVGRNVYSFILSVYPNITKQNKEENNIFKNEYISTIQVDSTSYDVKFIINEVVDIEYLDVIVTGKSKAQLIKCLEQIQETIFTSGIRDYYIDIVSYDSISEY